MIKVNVFRHYTRIKKGVFDLLKKIFDKVLDFPDEKRLANLDEPAIHLSFSS